MWRDVFATIFAWTARGVLATAIFVVSVLLAIFALIMAWMAYPRPQGDFTHELLVASDPVSDEDHLTYTLSLERFYGAEMSHVCVFASTAGYLAQRTDRLEEAARRISNRLLLDMDSDFHHLYIEFADGSYRVDRSHFLSNHWRMDPDRRQPYCALANGHVVEISLTRNSQAGGGDSYWVSFVPGE